MNTDGQENDKTDVKKPVQHQPSVARLLDGINIVCVEVCVC